MLARPEYPYRTRAAYLRAMAALVREGGSATDAAPGYCVDPVGRDIFATPDEIEAKSCVDCKKHAILAATRARAAGHQVDLAISVTGRPHEHVWIRVDGIPVDPSVAAGMPPPAPALYRGGVIVSV